MQRTDGEASRMLLNRLPFLVVQEMGGSSNFIPTDDAPQEAIDYCKYMMGDLVDFDVDGFERPTGVGMNL